LFYKTTTFSLNEDNFEILDDNLIKTAAIKLPDGIKYDSDFFYMVVKAVSAGEFYGSNKNADYFPEDELKKNYKTFLTAHFFKNHENKDVSKAIGDVLDSQWDDKMKCVKLLIRVDRKLAPTIVRGFEKGFMTDVSMGCRIKHSVCSYCGNKAKVRSEYCNHIRNMKNQVLDDGTKIFEINIEPKFHDISAVLNGAEKSAKVLDLKLDKSCFDANIKKVASIKENFLNEDIGIEKCANDKVDNLILNSLEIFPEKIASNKKEYLQKIADIKKEIVGKITNSAEGEVLSDRYKNIENLRSSLKLFYDEYWNKEKCVEIAENIKRVAIKKELPLRDAFDQFLKVLDFAGIELTPLEFNDIFNSLIGSSPSDFREQFKDIDIPGNCVEIADENVARNDISKLINFPSMFDTLNEKILPITDNIQDLVRGSKHPLGKVKAIIVTIKRRLPMLNEDLAYNDMMDFVKDEMPQRSMHPRFFVDRISNLPSKPLTNNAPHFLPAMLMRNDTDGIGDFLKYIIPSLLYANYQGQRVQHLASDNFTYGLEKFASHIEGDTIDNLTNEFIEKTALLGKGYTTRKALAYGLPAVFGYSAIQRSRLKNRENLSGFNRYMAENPANAYVLQAFAPKIVKTFKGKGLDVSKKLQDISSKYYKKADDENNNIFKNASIDKTLKEKYTDKQISAIKYACVLNELKRQDVADEILSINKLSEYDIDNFLNICKEAIKTDFNYTVEKVAGAIGSVIKDVGTYSLFTNPKKSALSALPSNLVDASIFAYIGHKLTKKPKNSIKNQTIQS